MIFSSDYDKNIRSIYIGYLIKLLHKKYFVSISPLAKELGINSNYFNSFARGLKSMPIDRLDDIENFLIDLYGSILIDEIPQDKKEFNDFILNLKDSLIYKEIVG